MNRISTLSQPSAGFSGAMLEDESRTALDSAQPELTISQMSRVFGVSLRTLRFYEDRGLIKPRREGNARYYRGSDRIRMEMILKGKKLGFTLTEIQDLLGGKGASRLRFRMREPHFKVLDRRIERVRRSGRAGRVRSFVSSGNPFQTSGGRIEPIVVG